MRGSKDVFLFLLLAFSCCPHLWGQDPVYLHYALDAGLPSNEVYDVIQDQRGNLWFATDHGISRFDGYTFSNFSTQDGLSDNTAFEFTSDPGQRVWIRCMDGSLSYIDHLGIHPYFFNAELKKSLGDHRIETFGIDSTYHMYLTSAMGCFRLYLPTGRMDTVTFPKGTNVGLIRSGVAAREILVETNAQVCEHQPFSQPIASKGNLFWGMPLSPAPQRPIAVELEDNGYACLVKGQLLRIEDGCITATIPVSRTPSLARDKAGTLLVPESGLLRMNHCLETVEHLLRGWGTFTSFQDNEGGYWITTTDGLLYVRNLDYRQWTEVDGHALGAVLRLRLADSILYVATASNQLFAIDPHPGEGRLTLLHTLPLLVNYHDFLPVPGQQAAISSRKLIRLGTSKASGPLVMKGVMGSPWYYHRSARHFLMATSEGFGIYDLGHRLLFSSTQDKRFQAFCFAAIEDQAGTVWIGTTKGLYTFDGDTVMPFHHEDPAFQERVTDMALLPGGGLAVATLGQGLLLVRATGWLQVDERLGLATNLCDRVHVGETGLWVSTNKGLNLVRMSADTENPLPEVLHFHSGNGLPSNQVNDAVEMGKHVYVATPKGLTVFSIPDSLAPPPLPPVHVLALQTNQRRLLAPAPLLREESDLQFEFISPLLSMPGKAEYRYVLEGLDEHWIITRERTATYHDLPPGQYHFRVQARAPGGTWNPIEATWTVDLPQQFHESAWFRWSLGAGMALVMAIIGTLYFQDRRRRHRANVNRLQSEIKALRSQMRPHFIFNALNSIQHLILLHDNATAQVHLARFAKLMRGILEASNQERIPISMEIELLQMYLELEKLRLGDTFAYHIALDQSMDWERCMIPPLLLQPLVENAIWHGLRQCKHHPTLWLRFRRHAAHHFLCEVEDNGIGRQAASQIENPHRGTSMGIANIQERIRLINALLKLPIRMEIHDLLLPSGAPRGTLVQLFIPISHAS